MLDGLKKAAEARLVYPAFPLPQPQYGGGGGYAYFDFVVHSFADACTAGRVGDKSLADVLKAKGTATGTFTLFQFENLQLQ